MYDFVGFFYINKRDSSGLTKKYSFHLLYDQNNEEIPIQIEYNISTYCFTFYKSNWRECFILPPEDWKEILKIFENIDYPQEKTYKNIQIVYDDTQHLNITEYSDFKILKQNSIIYQEDLTQMISQLKSIFNIIDKEYSSKFRKRKYMRCFICGYVGDPFFHDNIRCNGDIRACCNCINTNCHKLRDWTNENSIDFQLQLKAAEENIVDFSKKEINELKLNFRKYQKELIELFDKNIEHSDQIEKN